MHDPWASLQTSSHGLSRSLRNDRYAMFLVRDHWRSCDLDRWIVGDVMRWWLRGQEYTIFQYAQEHCWYCGYQRQAGKRQLCFDHAFPVYYATTPLVPCCLVCNLIKGDRTPNEARKAQQLVRFWFEQGTLAISPLGYALQEDCEGFQRLLTRFLIEASSVSNSTI